MNFLAYRPDKNGNEPMGTADKCLWLDRHSDGLKTTKGAIKRARRLIGTPFKLFSFTNIYDEKTYKKIV